MGGGLWVMGCGLMVKGCRLWVMGYGLWVCDIVFCFKGSMLRVQD
jgi:hypothetical protein